MIINILKYLLIFAVSVVLQILIFNNIIIARMITPFFYILFILLLPFDTPRALLIVLAFILGLSIDMFTNTPGVHASASMLIGFLRPGILQLISPHDTIESSTIPRVETMGLQWFASYSSILILIHHISLFFIEAFTLNNFATTLLRAVLSAILSTVIIVLSQFLFFRK